jgi:hypothetical protein
MGRRCLLGRSFCRQQSQRHECFLALAFVGSYGTVDSVQNQAAETYNIRELGTFDGVKVLDSAPRGGGSGPLNDKVFLY